jgi:ectoine hydroxylase-related dioxygenase (phytanoyl-CoA dioxygenase family)
MLIRTSPKRHSWLGEVIEALRFHGCAIVENVIPPEMIADTRQALYRTRDAIIADIGLKRLEDAGEVGVLRLPMKYEPIFLRYLAIPEILEIIDTTVSSTAILHLQNGFILPPMTGRGAPEIFQTSFHQDFPRVLNGYVASINIMISVDAFTAENGGTLVVPGTHQTAPAPSPAFMMDHALAIEAPPGSLLIFDSTLWHAAGRNTSGRDRLAINHQFTRSFVKRQIDYVRALGPALMETLPARTQQLLGWYTRVVTSLDEYYRPPGERLYRKNQG